jgi:hypothetical protein
VRADLAEALVRHTSQRRERLRALSATARRLLLEELIADFFIEQRQVLLKWSALTGQSAQIDTGYIAQHLASVVLGEPGQGFKGKGLDLADGSEVKSAALLSGVDRPRWNHNMGTLASDTHRARRGLPPMWESYFVAPRVFYVLFDRLPSDVAKLRVRAWCVCPERDDGWRDLFERYARLREDGRYNLQLHPPIGRDDDLVVNTLGNLDFRDVKVCEAAFALDASLDGVRVEWIVAPNEAYRSGVTVPSRYVRDPARRTELEGVDGHTVPTEDELRRLFRTFRSS